MKTYSSFKTFLLYDLFGFVNGDARWTNHSKITCANCCYLKNLMETASVIERLKMQIRWGDVAQTRSFEYLIVSKPIIQIRWTISRWPFAKVNLFAVSTSQISNTDCRYFIVFDTSLKKKTTKVRKKVVTCRIVSNNDITKQSTGVNRWRKMRV